MYKKSYLIMYPLIFFFVLFILLSINPISPKMGKLYALSKIPKKYQLPMTVIKHESDIDKIKKYPVVFKPEGCSGGCKDVKLINSRTQAKEYFQQTKVTFIAQDFLKSNYEAGVLF